MNNKKALLLLISIFTAMSSFASQPKEIVELKKIFDRFKIDGSILIYDQNENIYMGYNLDRCNVAFSPASTFKIPNTLIALENKIVDLDYIFKWDGQKRYLPQWEKDMTIAEAFKVSCVPVYQEIARRVGVEKMKYYVQLFNYGNMDIHADNIDKFWLEGNSSITKYHRTLTSYLNSLLKQGFKILEVVEPQPSPEMLDEFADMKDELRRPMMLLISAKKEY